MLNNSRKTKNTLYYALTISIFLWGIMLVLSIFGGIPYILESFGNANKLVSAISIFLVGVSYFIMFIILLKIVDSSGVNIFITKNTKRFRKLGYLLFLNLVLNYVCMLCNGVTGMRIIDLFPGIFITPQMAIYFILALLCFVIGDTINEATTIKNENDLTV